MSFLRRTCCFVNYVHLRELLLKRVGEAFQRRDFQNTLGRVNVSLREKACCGMLVRRALSSQNDHSSLDPNIEHYLSSLNLLDSVENTSDMTLSSKRKLYTQIVQNLESVYGKHKVTVAHLTSFGRTGLVALAASICREDPSLLKESEGIIKMEKSPYITVRFKVPHHQTEFDIPWYYTSSSVKQQSTLLDLSKSSNIGAELLSEYMEASCGGNGSCSTCHVYIDTPNGTDSTDSVVLSDATESELDMISLAYKPTDKSRLACQVRVSKVPLGMNCVKEPALTVVIPPGVNNFWN